MKLKELLWTLTPFTLRTPAFWRRSWKHRAARLVLGSFYCYVGVVFMLWLMENRLLFRPTRAAAGWSPPPKGVAVEDVNLTSTDDTALHAWWSEPTGWTPSRGSVLFFHGNAGNLSHRGSIILLLQNHLKTGVLLVDYPGYGRSGGVPTEKGCYAAGDAAYQWLIESKHAPGSSIILLGGSLGGGIATDLAVRCPHRALVIVSSFTSFPEQAQTVCPWTPARWIVSNQFNNRKKLADVTGPVFIAHGRDDTLIPFTMSEQLFAAANEPKMLFPMEFWGHGDGLSVEALAALTRFLQEHPVAKSD